MNHYAAEIFAKDHQASLIARAAEDRLAREARRGAGAPSRLGGVARSLAGRTWRPRSAAAAPSSR